MPDIDTTEGAAQTPDPDASTDAAGAGSGQPDEVSLWRSRFNGQTAKVTALSKVITEREQALAEMERELKAARETSASADEAAKALVAAARAELELERKARRTETLKARFPESFSVLGDVAAGLDETVLAANEARLTGTTGGGEEDEPPTPLRHNEARSAQAGAGTKAKEPTAADVRARLESMPLPEGWK